MQRESDAKGRGAKSVGYQTAERSTKCLRLDRSFGVGWTMSPGWRIAKSETA